MHIQKLYASLLAAGLLAVSLAHPVVEKGLVSRDQAVSQVGNTSTVDLAPASEPSGEVDVTGFDDINLDDDVEDDDDDEVDEDEDEDEYDDDDEDESPEIASGLDRRSLLSHLLGSAKKGKTTSHKSGLSTGVTKKPASSKPKSGNPAIHKPDHTNKPTDKTPGTKKPGTKKPGTKKPGTKKPASSCKRKALFGTSSKSKGASAGGASKGRGKGTKATRDLSKRANIEVDLGQTATGGHGDSLWTQALDPCIGLMATDGQGRKVMTHAGPAQLQANYETFKNTVNTQLGPNPKVYANFPHEDQMGPEMRDALKAATKYVKTEMNKDFSKSPEKFHTRAPPSGQSQQVGIIGMDANGLIWANECPASLA